MNKRLIHFVWLIPMLWCGQSVSSAKADVPGLCPLWPIDQLDNGDYLYYAEYCDAICNPSAAYLQGVYPWPVDCATEPHLCEGSTEFQGLTVYAGATDDPRAHMPPGPPVPPTALVGFARQHAIFVQPHLNRTYVSFNLTGGPRYAVVFRVRISKSATSKDHEIIYGFELDPMTPPTHHFPLGGIEFLDEFGNASPTPHLGKRNKVIRGTFAFGNTCIVFLHQ